MTEQDLINLKEEVQLIPLVDTIKMVDISDEVYFSKAYANYISNSRLSLINPDQGGSEEKYLAGFGGNFQASDSLYFGSAIHEMFLQPEEFYVVKGVFRPTAKLGFMADEIIKFQSQGMELEQAIIAASDKVGYFKGKMDDNRIQKVIEFTKEYREQKSSHVQIPGKEPIFLSEKDHDRHKRCMNSLINNREINSILYPETLFDKPVSMNESTLLMDVKAIYKGEESIHHLKAKLDNWVLDTENGVLELNDLKTTGHLLTQFPESFEKWHYYRQMGMYWYMLNLYVNKMYGSKYKGQCNMLVVSTCPDYRAGVYRVKNEQVKQGLDEFSYLLRLVVIAEHNARINSEQSSL